MKFPRQLVLLDGLRCSSFIIFHINNKLKVKWCHDALGMIEDLEHLEARLDGQEDHPEMDDTTLRAIERISQYINAVLADLSTTSQVGNFKDLCLVSLYT